MDMIKINNTEINGSTIETVDARELHGFLESKQDFSTWIKGRITQYGFVENKDFAIFDSFVRNPNGGRSQTEYRLALDMAKVIAVVERSARGRLALRKLIENPITTASDLFDLIKDVDPDLRDDLFVYAIKEVETGRVKIGISKNPAERIRQLQTGNPNRLEIAGIVEASNGFSDEKLIHKKLSNMRIRGEWFDPGKKPPCSPARAGYTSGIN